MRFLVMLAGFAGVLGLVATPGQADPGTSGADASFLAALTKAGITYQDPTVAVAVGKKACELMDQGNPEVGVIKSGECLLPAALGATDHAGPATTVAIANHRLSHHHTRSWVGSAGRGAGDRPAAEVSGTRRREPDRLSPCLNSCWPAATTTRGHP
jgi:hypothetical protein